MLIYTYLIYYGSCDPCPPQWTKIIKLTILKNIIHTHTHMLIFTHKKNKYIFIHSWWIPRFIISPHCFHKLYTLNKNRSFNYSWGTRDRVAAYLAVVYVCTLCVSKVDVRKIWKFHRTFIKHGSKSPLW